jgi:hypothetical protein
MKSGIPALFVLLMATSASGADVAGDWQFVARILNDVTYARVTLTVEGGRLGGTLNELKLEGALSGDDVAFTATRPNGQRFGEFKGTVKGDQLSGTASWPGIASDITWSATRAKGHPPDHRCTSSSPANFTASSRTRSRRFCTSFRAIR